MESGSIWATDLHGGRLWLGAGRDARNLEQLRAHGITHVLDCADDVPWARSRFLELAEATLAEWAILEVAEATRAAISRLSRFFVFLR